MLTNPFYLLSILCSSLLAFFTVAFVVDLCVPLFKIKAPRVRATLRLLPFVSLGIDFLFNRFSIASWINPLSCSSCVQKFFLSQFQPELKAYLYENEISLTQHLGLVHQHPVFAVLTILVGGFALLMGLRVAIGAFRTSRALNYLKQRGNLVSKSIENVYLYTALQEEQVIVYVSSEIQIPFATYAKEIFMPQNTLKILSVQEYEAVIAHELEHIKRRDPLVRLVYHCIASLFWWVPTQHWIKRMEQEQELACDEAVQRYNLEGDALASALLKVIVQEKLNSYACFFNPTQVRIKAALGQLETPLVRLNLIGVVTGAIFMWVCMVWL